MFFPGGFTFSNFLLDVFVIFAFVLWFWLLITVMSDLFRRDDVSGLGKVAWFLVLFILPYLGIFFYLLICGRGMAERRDTYAREARDELRRTLGVSVADELEKLEKLKAAGTITEQEYSRLRTRLVS